MDLDSLSVWPEASETGEAGEHQTAFKGDQLSDWLIGFDWLAGKGPGLALSTLIGSQCTLLMIRPMEL